MATEQVAQWAEPSGRETMEEIADSTLQAASSAIGQAGGTARRVAAGAREVVARTTSIIKRAAPGGRAAAAGQPAPDGVPVGTERSEHALAQVLPWVAAASACWLVFTSTLSWAQAAIAGTCLFALFTLRAMHNAQRLEALALRQQLSELRLSLRVTQALLDVETTTEAEHLDEELEDPRKSGTRRLQRQRNSQRGARPQVG
jgi:hypothetical protein